jgi:hypothetical protein
MIRAVPIISTEGMNTDAIQTAPKGYLSFDAEHCIFRKPFHVVASTELCKMRFTTDSPTDDCLVISAFKLPSVTPDRVIRVVFLPDQYKIESMERGRTVGTCFVGVSDGRLALSGASKSIPYDEATGAAEAVCRELLESFFKSYADEG